jgi:hypothetical protein
MTEIKENFRYLQIPLRYPKNIGAELFLLIFRQQHRYSFVLNPSVKLMCC